MLICECLMANAYAVLINIWEFILDFFKFYYTQLQRLHDVQKYQRG